MFSVRGDKAGAGKEQNYVDMVELDTQKDLVEGQERNRLNSTMRNWEFLSAISHHLRGKKLSWGELRDNL